MHKNKLFIQILIFFVAFGLFGGFAKAAELEITCNEGNDPCEVLPDRDAPVFDDTVFPHNDLKPGDEFTRKILVTNNRDEVCYLTIDTFVIDEDTVTSTGVKFSEELLTEFSGSGNSTGEISFDTLFSSTPLYVGEIDKVSNNPNNIKEFDWRVKFDTSAGNEFQRARLQFDFDWTFQCGEEPQTPVLFIEKTNNKLGVTQAPGDDVVYTITVFTTELPVFNVFVLDLPPGGFTYRGGTWTANSDLRGDLVALGVTSEPVYASPAIWQLGDMAANETVTLTYVTDISDTQQSGIYPDIAYTEGTAANDPASDRVIGNLGTGFFVGTTAAITVVPNPEVNIEVEEEEIEEGEVLGVSTKLPATGADNTWALIILSLLGAGLGFVIIGRLIGKKISSGGSKLITSIIIFGLFSLLLTTKAFAANVLVRIEEPETPSNVDTLLLNFVAMDVENRPITVKCFKKGPSDGAFTQFGSDIVLPAGGNDGVCSVGPGILSQEGTYRFYITAQADLDTSTSATVVVDHDTDRPDDPKYIEKKKKGSCKYEIKIKTADDGGETKRVRVYRSEDTDFVADSGTQIRDITVGSDEKVEFTDDKPDCGKTYYYAVIAYDDAGNRSGVVVEKIDVVITVTVRETVVEEGSPFGEIIEAIAVEEGQVSPPAGEDQVVTDEEEVEITPDEDGEVLGEEIAQEGLAGFLAKYGWIILILLVIVLFILYATGRGKKDEEII